MGVFLKRYATKLSLLCVVAALSLFIPAALTSRPGLRTFLIVMIALLLVGGGALLFYGNRHNAGKIHYFLYDRRRDRFYRREELTASAILDTMEYYLRDFVDNGVSLWQEIPKALHLQLEGEEQFRPLVAYYMLSTLSACEPQEALAAFSEAQEQTVTYLCRAINECGDCEMADFIYHLKKNCATEQERISLFFRKNKRAFEARSLRYLNRHFDYFYVAKSRLGK